VKETVKVVRVISMVTSSLPTAWLISYRTKVIPKILKSGICESNISYAHGGISAHMHISNPEPPS
jgi:hypothetical protein